MADVGRADKTCECLNMGRRYGRAGQLISPGYESSWVSRSALIAVARSSGKLILALTLLEQALQGI